MAAGDTYKYVNQFQEHVDNVLEKVQGDHLNVIQEAVKSLQTDSITTQSKAFLDSCLFILDNNPYINYMFYMDLTTQDDIFRSKSSGYSYNADEGCVYVTTPPYIATVHSVMYNPTYGKYVNEFVLKADAIIPRGAGIRYYISKDLNNYYPIQSNDAGMPISFDVVFDKIYIKAELVPNASGESPRLFAVALFCLDKAISPDSYLANPDLVPSETPVDTVGDVILIYNEDNKLSTVISPDGAEVTLHYNLDGVLDSLQKVQGQKVTDVELIRDELSRVSIIRSAVTNL